MGRFDVLPSLPVDKVHFVCVGTDRSTGDALGPLVGSMLHDIGFNVSGTLENPCHALSLEEHIAAIPSGRTIIAVDAVLGRNADIGMVKVREGYLRPGAGVGKSLPPVGEYAITGCVNVSGFMEYFVLQNTSLYKVMQMAEEIVQGIRSVYLPSTISDCRELCR